jgi:hypothetical protein
MTDGALEKRATQEVAAVGELGGEFLINDYRLKPGRFLCD